MLGAIVRNFILLHPQYVWDDLGITPEGIELGSKNEKETD
jgi:hypothetical protein